MNLSFTKVRQPQIIVIICWVASDSSNHPSPFELYFAHGKTDSEGRATKGEVF